MSELRLTQSQSTAKTAGNVIPLVAFSHEPKMDLMMVLIEKSEHHQSDYNSH